MSKRAISIIIASFLTVFIAFAIRYGYGMLLPEMLPDLGITKTEAGVIFSSYFIAYTVLAPFLGYLTDKSNIRILLAIFTGILALGAFLMAFASSLVEATFYFTISGIGQAACWVPVVALVQRWVSDKRRGTALAVVDSGSALGIAVTGAVIPLIVGAYDWRMGWITVGVFGFVMAILNFLMIRDRPATDVSSTQQKTEKRSIEPLGVVFKKLLRDSKFWLIGISYLFIGFSILVPFTFLSTFAVEELMMPYDVSVRVITTIGIAAIAGKLILGPLSDRIGRIGMMILCGGMIGLGCLGIAYSPGLFMLILSTIVFGIGYGACWTLYAASAYDYFPRQVTGSIIGLWTVILGFGSIASPVFSGWLADTTGTLSWSFLSAMAGGLLAGGLLIPIWLMPHRGLSKETKLS